MTQSLVDWVDRQLAVDSDLPEDVALLVLAALEGDDVLREYVEGAASVTRSDEPGEVPEAEAKGVVLTSITVEGFRGIGPEATLSIDPKPGLTVVAGRNGSGKSSFSEALELLLTGDTYRWANKSAEWREQWRNLHHPTARVSIGLVEEGSGEITIESTWADDEVQATGRTVRSQMHGQPKVTGTSHLGWHTALEQFRPILSYDELGGMLDGRPADLYDALASILGVAQLGDAMKRLKNLRDGLRAPMTVAGKRRRELQEQAAGAHDERAKQAAALLRKSSPDTGALRALVTGSGAGDLGPISSLRSLTSLSAPDPTAIESAVDRLRTAKNDLADAGASVSQRSRDRLRLLDQGLELHAHHGDQTCPVCREGQLDSSWAQTSREIADRSRREFAEVEQSHQTFELAFDSLRRSLTPPPHALRTSPVSELDDVVLEARDAWARWSEVKVTRDAAGADVLTEHVARTFSDLTAAVELVREQATKQIAVLDDDWQPLAAAIAAWCEQWDECSGAEQMVKDLDTAHKWLTANDLRLKNERLAPIEEGARAAWHKLRQESNVEIGSLALTGSATRRRVKVSGAVDGKAVDSFAVFSQGELHALALSLFLPRATLAQSPFRFVVLDDPVQAMDPAKVDGLVQLLGELAQSRQVVVFSHDDRLPAALRRSSFDATILEVTRGAQSTVTVSTAVDPTARYLADAHGLIKEWQDGRLTEDDLNRAMPGLLRFAIESAAKDRYFESQLRAGRKITDLEREWTSTRTTKMRVRLAVFGEQPSEPLYAEWVRPPYRKVALGIVAGGFHSGLKGSSPEDAHHHAKRLVDDIRAGAR